jgi:hypothetical protein
VAVNVYIYDCLSKSMFHTKNKIFENFLQIHNHKQQQGIRIFLPYSAFHYEGFPSFPWSTYVFLSVGAY